MSDFLKVAFWWLIIVILALTIGFYCVLAKPACIHTLEKMGIEGSWGFWEGCMVKTNDFGVIPLDQYLFVVIAK